MVTNNRYAMGKKCGCKSCRAPSGFKSFEYKNSQRKARKRDRQRLRSNIDLSDFLPSIAYAGYTD